MIAGEWRLRARTLIAYVRCDRYNGLVVGLVRI
jgi:hypothetical protein